MIIANRQTERFGNMASVVCAFCYEEYDAEPEESICVVCYEEKFVSANNFYGADNE